MQLEDTCFYNQIYRVCPYLELTGIVVQKQVSLDPSQGRIHVNALVIPTEELEEIVNKH